MLSEEGAGVNAMYNMPDNVLAKGSPGPGVVKRCPRWERLGGGGMDPPTVVEWEMLDGEQVEMDTLDGEQVEMDTYVSTVDFKHETIEGEVLVCGRRQYPATTRCAWPTP